MYGLKTTQKGFSFVEALIYIGLMSVGFLIIVGFVQNISSARVKSRTIEEVQQEARFALHRVSIAMHNATGIDESRTVLNSDSGALAVQTDTGTTLFSIVDGKLRMTDQDGRVSELTSSLTQVDTFRIEDRTPGEGSEISDVKITFHLSHVNPYSSNLFSSETTLSTTLSLRP